MLSEHSKYPGSTEKEEISISPKTALQVDVNPQFLRLQVTETATNTFTEAKVATPNLSEAGYVMEILKIFAMMEHVVLTQRAAGDMMQWAVYDRSKTALPSLSDSGVLFRYADGFDIVTSGGANPQKVINFDFTDGAGNGILYGKKELFAGIKGESLSQISRVDFAILYRLKKVSVAEMIGLVAD